MKMSRPIAMLAAVAVFASVAGAATAPPVLKQIPAGSLGFVVVNNVKATASRVDKFIKDIGVSKFVPPGGVLSLIKGQANLGAGFNADGGVAVVMLDPQQFGFDLIALIKAGPDAQPPKPSDIPVVIFVPGSGVKEVFGELAKPAGKYFQLMLPVPIMATHRNGYVIISPSPAAIKAVLTAKKTAADELAKEHTGVIAKSDIAYYLNMKVAGPIINGLLKMLEKEFAGAGMTMPMLADPTAVLGLYRELLSQMDALTITGKLGATGVSLDIMVSFSPDSLLSKVAAAFPGTAKPTVARLPNLPYVMAIGALAEESKEARQFADSMTEKMFGKDVPKALRDRLARIQKVSNTNVTGVQLVAGGAPQNSGLFGVAALIECNNTKAVKQMMTDVVGLIESAIKSINPNDQDLQQLKIAYSNNVSTIGTIAIDAIVITHPEMDNMPPRERKEMKQILGEDKILIRVAAIDNKTVAVTFGGGAAFMNETIRAAKVGGRIISRKDTRAMAKHMPEKPTGFMLFSVGNLFEVINTGMKKMEPDASMPFKISTKDPIVFSAGYTGKSSHMILYVPTKLIKDAVEAIGGFLGAMGGGIPLPPPGGEF